MLVVERAVDDFVGRLGDGIGDLRVQAELLVDLSSGFFEHSEGLNDGGGHALGCAVPNREVHHGAKRLSAIVLVVRYLQLT